MKDKIIATATETFVKLGVRSVTMDDIAQQMGISKKTIYKYFKNKEALITETAQVAHSEIHQVIADVCSRNLNPIAEMFEVRRIFKGFFLGADTSPVFQLKKYYPGIYESIILRERETYHSYTRQNIERGIAAGYYREDLEIEHTIQFYYTLIFNLHETDISQTQIQELERSVLIYHLRAISTTKGLKELDHQLSIENP